MKFNTAIVLACTIFAISATSCKQDEVPEVTYNVTFTIIEPEADFVAVSGDELHMEVDLQGTKAIGNAEMLLIDEMSGDTLFTYSTTTTSDFLTMHEHYIPSVAMSTMCHFMVSAWESNYADRLTEEVHLTINP